jgi:hypothetical protein
MLNEKMRNNRICQPCFQKSTYASLPAPSYMAQMASIKLPLCKVHEISEVILFPFTKKCFLIVTNQDSASIDAFDNH